VPSTPYKGLGESGRNSTMIDREMIRRLNNCDTDKLIGVLELNEDRLYPELFIDYPIQFTKADDHPPANILPVKSLWF
jgi:hypothetical protein